MEALRQLVGRGCRRDIKLRTGDFPVYTYAEKLGQQQDGKGARVKFIG